MNPSVLIFSEEYIKITKGMFVVWRNHASEASKRFQVDILLNNEHWAAEAAMHEFASNANINLHQLSFKMPSTLVNAMFGWCDNIWILRAGRYALGQCLNLKPDVYNIIIKTGCVNLNRVQFLVIMEAGLLAFYVAG